MKTNLHIYRQHGARVVQRRNLLNDMFLFPVISIPGIGESHGARRTLLPLCCRLSSNNSYLSSPGWRQDISTRTSLQSQERTSQNTEFIQGICRLSTNHNLVFQVLFSITLPKAFLGKYTWKPPWKYISILNKTCYSVYHIIFASKSFKAHLIFSRELVCI